MSIPGGGGTAKILSVWENKHLMKLENRNIDKKRIAKNTLFLFIRMLIVIGVGFFTVRLVLKQLGVNHYAVYSLVFGFVGFFCIASQGMSTMLQRFICHESGLNHEDKLPQIFTAGIILTAIYAVVILIWGETVGIWLLTNKLNIASHLLAGAKNAYHLVLLSTVMQVFTIPYMAMIISYERMSFLAKISLGEATCKFIVALILIYQNGDLYTYSLYILLTSFIVFLGYAWFCHRYIPACCFKRIQTKDLWYQMASFASWNILESTGTLIRVNGLGLVLNAFCSITYNATWSVSGQIRAIMTQLYNNLLGAATPQIHKSYTYSDKYPFYNLLCSTARYAFILLWIVSFPLLFKTDLLLRIWLGNNLPPEIIPFTRYNVIFTLINGLFCSLWVAAQTNGKVIRYQIEYFLLCTATLICAWLIMKLNAPAIAIAIVFTVSNVANLLIRLLYVIKHYQFPIKMYLSKVILPAHLLVILSCSIAFCVDYVIPCTVFGDFAFICLCTILINPLLIIAFALSSDERAFLAKKLNGYFCIFRGEKHESR